MVIIERQRDWAGTAHSFNSSQPQHSSGSALESQPRTFLFPRAILSAQPSSRALYLSLLRTSQNHLALNPPHPWKNSSVNVLAAASGGYFLLSVLWFLVQAVVYDFLGLGNININSESLNDILCAHSVALCMLSIPLQYSEEINIGAMGPSKALLLCFNIDQFQLIQIVEKSHWGQLCLIASPDTRQTHSQKCSFTLVLWEPSLTEVKAEAWCLSNLTFTLISLLFK